MVQVGGRWLLNVCLQMFYLKPLSKLLPFLFGFSLQELAKFESLLKEGRGEGACRIPGMPARLEQPRQHHLQEAEVPGLATTSESSCGESNTQKRLRRSSVCVCVYAFPAWES